MDKPTLFRGISSSCKNPVRFVIGETHELCEELVGSYLYQVHLYHWLESNDYGRFLSDNDL